MLSAFSQKVSELESKLDDHEKCLEELKTTLNDRDKENEDPVKNIPKEIQRILLSFQGELKDQSFVVNTVQSKVHSFKEELNSFREFIYENLAKQTELDLYMNILYDLRADVDKLTGNYNGHSMLMPSFEQEECVLDTDEAFVVSDMGAETTVTSTLNPNVEEFKPRLSLPLPVSPALPTSGDQILSEFQQDLGSENSNRPTEEAVTINIPDVNSESYTSSGDDQRERKISLPACLSEEEYADMKREYLPSPNEGSLECSPETVSYKHHTMIMEQELAEKEQALAEANGKLEAVCTAQEELLKKMEWLEHKVRLLKQDKKRRGETIGKLLRCIDDLRNCGKLDLTRATTERAILTSTLSTRGMPHDERIQVAINVTEAEQLHQYCPDDNSPKFAADGLQVATAVLPDTNISASEPQLQLHSSPNYELMMKTINFTLHQIYLDTIKNNHTTMY